MKRATAWALGGLLGLVVSAGCHKTPDEPAPVASTSTTTTATLEAHPSCPTDPEPGLPPLPTAVLTLPEATGGPLHLEAELVQSEHDVTRGLMYRTSMPADHGMLFLLPREDHAFWMHNTCIPLDLVYLDDGVIVGIVENAPPLNDIPRRVGRESNTVLEVNGGWCRQHGVHEGQRVVLPGMSH